MGYISMQVMGNLTKDPECYAGRNESNNRAVFTLAVDVYCGNGNTRTEYVRVTAWGKRAELCGKYFRKGSEVMIIGVPRAHGYASKDGEPRAQLELSVEEIVFTRGTMKEEDEQEATQDNSEMHETEDDGLPF